MKVIKPQKAVIHETVRIAVGVFAMVAVMIAVYAVIGKFRTNVLFGGLYTGLVTVMNFFIMGLTVQSVAEKAAEKERSEEEMESLKKRMKAKMQVSYSYRMIFMFAMVIIGITVFEFDALATILPLVFPRFVITVLNLKSNVSTKGSV